MITLRDYFFRRSTGQQLDEEFRDELTDEKVANAQDLLNRVNPVLVLFYQDHPEAPRRQINSGWRPTKINAEVGGAPKGPHPDCEGIDLGDVDRLFAKWCVRNQHILVKFGLRMERPEATPTWVHLDKRYQEGKPVMFWPTTQAYQRWVAAGSQALVG